MRAHIAGSSCAPADAFALLWSFERIIGDLMVQKSSPKRLDQLDKNFKSIVTEQALRWIDAFDRRIAIRGRGWPAENDQKKHFRRLPDRATSELSEGVQALSHCPASVFLSFFTAAPDISVRLTVTEFEQVNHMPATGLAGVELYYREGSRWYAAAGAAPSPKERTITTSLMKNGSGQLREYRLYLPLYQQLEQIEIGLTPGARIKAAPSIERPVVFYGTSITQGGCANTAGSDFVSQLGRMLETEVANLGFSGNGRGEPEMARLISEIDARAFILDYAANAELELLRATLPKFVAILRKRHPLTPIVLLGCVPFNQSRWDRSCFTLLEQKRDVIMAHYIQARKAGDRHLHFIDGHGLLPMGESGVFVDGIHPTSLGFAILAERLRPQLSRILSWETSS